MRTSGALLLGALIALITGGSRASEPPPVKFLDTPQGRWYAANNQRVSPTAIRFRDGSCFDAARLEPAWIPIDNHQFHFQAVVADPKRINIRPAQWEAKPTEPRLGLTVSGWSRAAVDDQAWPVATPERFKDNIKTGLFRPVALWRQPMGLEAFAGPGSGPGNEQVYANKRRFTQCRDYMTSPIIAYRVISVDGQYSLQFSVHPTERERLPQIIATLSRTIQSARGPCRAAGKVVKP